MILPGEHVSIFGITGCGKSTLTEKIASIFPRRVIFDRLHQWPVAPDCTVTDFNSFLALYRSLEPLDSFTILVQPRAGMNQEMLLELTNNILAILHQAEKFNKRGLAIIFEEIWLYAPLHAIPPWFQEIILTGRNSNISIIGNAQRPASVSKFIVSQSRHVFVGQFFEYRDRKYYEDTFGRIPEIENPPAKFQFYWFRPNEKTLLVSTN